ncbi:hypothetical protein KVV02_005435, partial [Mortierella alpina]
MLDYALRILRRVHLAPQREERTRETKKKMAEKREAQAKKSENGARTVRARWKNKVKLLFDQLSDLLEREDVDLLRRRVPILIGLLGDLTARQPAQGIQTHLPPLASKLDQDDEDSDSGDDDDNDSVLGVAVGAQPVGVKDKNAPKEPSRARLRSLQSVLRVLLESDNIHDQVNRAWVRKT